MSGLRALVRCDGAVVPAQVAASSWDVQKSITSHGATAHLTLRAQSLAGTVLTHVAHRAADLVRIAAYIYAADQELSRGGPADIYGEHWRRSIALCIPVADSTFWQSDTLCSRLAAVLSFATDDEWSFHFSDTPGQAEQIPLGVHDEAVLHHPDTVVLFSGGADSLCATVEAVAEQGLRPVLVSHRPAPNIDSRQRALVDSLRRELPAWSFPHLSFWIHRRGADASDSSQRSRAFLFASLGAAVASEIGIEQVLLADNGIVSLNLPTSSQLVGALASRSTHPLFIRRFNEFMAVALQRPVRVSNPLQYRTRPEALRSLARAQLVTLLQETNSCSRGRGRPRVTPHCGYCSQCVDRRFGTLAACLEEHDIAEQYGLDIFTDALPEGEARTVAESYVRFALNIDGLAEDRVFDEYPHLIDAIDASDPRPDEVARQLIALLKRHATNVRAVMAQMTARYSNELVTGALPADSLIRLLVGGTPTHPPDREMACVFRKEGHVWTLAFHSLTIRLRHSVGLAYIAYLLQHPGHEFSALDLIAGPQGAGTTLASERIESKDRRPSARWRDPVIDPQARAEIRSRIADLEAQRTLAEMHNAGNKVQGLSNELATLHGYLSRATGLGGKSRIFDDATEKARQAVSKAIHRSLKEIATYHPPLGRHLGLSLRLGSHCRYDPDTPVPWTF